MNRNVCGLDRLVRFVVGPTLVLIAARLARGSPNSPPSSASRRLLGLGAGLWGIEITLTAVVQWCPLNAVLGIDTCERGPADWYRDVFGPAREEGAATAASRPVSP